MKQAIKIIECPRDAMQGIKPFIPTQNKVAYIQSLLRVGFDTLDFGSFVSSKAIPQMQDTADVLARLDLSQTTTKLLAIIANIQGAQILSQHKEIQYLGFPFSISENFQMRNTHKTIAESLITLEEILNIAEKPTKKLLLICQWVLAILMAILGMLILLAIGPINYLEWASKYCHYRTPLEHRPQK